MLVSGLTIINIETAGYYICIIIILLLLLLLIVLLFIYFLYIFSLFCSDRLFKRLCVCRIQE